MGSSRYCNREVWGHWAHKFIACRTDANLHNVGKVIIVSWSLWAQVTGRIIRLLQAHQEGLGLLCFADNHYLRNDTPGFGSVVLAADNGTKPLDRLSECLYSQPAGLPIGRNGILKCRGLGLDAGRPDIKPSSELFDECIEFWVRLQSGFETVE